MPQLVVLGVLHRLLAVHQAEQGGITAHMNRVDLITGRGNRRCKGMLRRRRRDQRWRAAVVLHLSILRVA